MHATNKHFSDKFNNGWKKSKNGRFIAIFAFYVNNLTLWTQKLLISIMAVGYCRVCSCLASFHENVISKVIQMADLLQFFTFSII